MAATVEHVIRVALDASVRRFLAHEAGVRAGGDPEDVHQARVGCRRMRSDLRTFKRFVDPDWADALGAELRWLGGELGAVRDLEVLRDRLHTHVAKLPDGERQTADAVVEQLTTDWEAARAEMLAAISSPRFEAVKARLQDAANAPALTPDAQEPAGDALPRVVHKAWKRVKNAVRELDANPPDEDLHEIRIRAKRARYASEAVVPVFGDAARRFGAAMARVQDVLGEHQDAVVARGWLAKTAADRSAAEAYAIGMLGEVEWQAAAAARAEFPEVWAWARRQELRRWM